MDDTANFDESAYLPIRMLNEYSYCRRLFHLMHVQGIFIESADTLSGSAEHKRRRKQTSTDDTEVVLPWAELRKGTYTLSDSQAGIVGKFDAVEVNEGKVIPVEDKHGAAPDGSTPFQIGGYSLVPHVWPNDQIQLGAQALLLRANGYACDRGRIYYRKTRTSVEIVIDDNLLSAVHGVASEARRMTVGPMPEPLLDSAKCIRCSLNAACLPDETHLLRGNLTEARQIVPGRDDAGILYAITPGTHIGLSGECLRIALPEGQTQKVPLKDVAHLCVLGNAQITTQAMLKVVEQGATVAFHSSGGWLRAIVSSPNTKNVQLRREQFLCFSRPENKLELARSVVRAKIQNQHTLLRRNIRGDKNCLEELKKLISRTEGVDSLESLRGLEGAAAKTYWTAFPTMLTKSVNAFDMHGRNRRPPKDPINAMLSFGYALLLRDFNAALHGVGLDPLFGFYHSVVPGRPALVLDMMEAFRPLIVDSLVIRLINTGEMKPDAFVRAEGFCQMKPVARRAWIEAYERRVDELITHPRFGYRLSYRRVFHLEARLLARALEGELPDYQPLTTR